MIDIVDYWRPHRGQPRLGPNTTHVLHDRIIVVKGNSGSKYDIFLYDEDFLYMWGTPSFDYEDPRSYKRTDTPRRWCRRSPVNGESHDDSPGLYTIYQDCKPDRNLDLSSAKTQYNGTRRADSLWDWPSGEPAPQLLQVIEGVIPPKTKCARLLWQWGVDLEWREEYILAIGYGWVRWAEFRNGFHTRYNDFHPAKDNPIAPVRLCEPWLMDDTKNWQDYV